MIDNDAFLHKIRHTLFNTTGPRYHLILPVFGPLATRLVKLAEIQPHERVLDLGTGTGAVALSAGLTAQHVAGIDFAATMLRKGRQTAVEAEAKNVLLYQGDMTRLPHPDGQFELSLASFGLNAVDPGQVFPEIWRVLKAGGRLILQEWGGTDEASNLIKQTVKRYKVDRAEGLLADLRRLGQTPRAWDVVGGHEAKAELLRRSGFGEVEVKIERETIPIDPETFFRFRTAWAPYQAEFAAMSAESRAAVENEIVSYLTTLVGDDGHFVWQPAVLRMIAWK